MITFTIEKRHLDEGKPKSCIFSPVALALREQYPKETWVVGVTFVWTETKIYVVPASLFKWIYEFDCGLVPMFPQTFTL